MRRYRFSLIRIFPDMSLDSVDMRENFAQRKPLYLHILAVYGLVSGANITLNKLK